MSRSLNATVPPDTIQALTDEGNAPQPCLRNNTREQQDHDRLATYQWPQAVILPSRQTPGLASRMHSGKQVRFRRTNRNAQRCPDCVVVVVS